MIWEIGEAPWSRGRVTMRRGNGGFVIIIPACSWGRFWEEMYGGTGARREVYEPKWANANGLRHCRETERKC